MNIDIYQGLGSPVFDKLGAELGKAVLSMPATNGFQFGSGFAGCLHSDNILISFPFFTFKFTD